MTSHKGSSERSTKHSHSAWARQVKDKVQALVHGPIQEDAETWPHTRACRRGGQGRDPRGSYRLNLEEDHGATDLELHGVVMTTGW